MTVQKTASIVATPGLKMECTTEHHEFVISGAPTMGGNGRGVDPAEALLAAVGACAAVIATSFAPLRGIELTSLAVDVVGDFDEYGFEFLKKATRETRKGFSRITTTYRIASSNTPEEVEEFVRFIDGMCPVRDTIEKPAAFVTDMVLNGGDRVEVIID